MAETVLVILVLMGLAWFGLRSIRNAAKRMATLSMTGARTKGHVRKIEKKRLSRTDDAYLVHIEFTTADGRKQTWELKVRHSDFDNYYEGQVLDIVYDPSNPENCAFESTVEEARAIRR